MSDGVVVLRSADSTARGGIHRPQDVAGALPESGAAADWVPTRQLIIVPRKGMGKWHSMFRLGALG